MPPVEKQIFPSTSGMELKNEYCSVVISGQTNPLKTSYKKICSTRGVVDLSSVRQGGFPVSSSMPRTIIPEYAYMRKDPDMNAASKALDESMDALVLRYRFV